jgi:hypothetical protein
MAKRFSRYRWANKKMNGAPPAGTPFDEYQKYRAGTKKVNYPRNGTVSNPQEMVQAFLVPFGVVDDKPYYVAYSKRAKDEGSELGVNASVLQIDEASVPLDYITNPGFTPARAVVTKRGAGKDPETSRITGEEYTKRTGTANYTFPFGRKGNSGANAVVQGVANQIRKAVEAKAARNGVSFKPENFRL